MKLEGWRCDICGHESSVRMHKVHLPIWTTITPRDIARIGVRESVVAVYDEPMDICDDCAKKIADWLYDNGMIGEKGE